MFTPQGFDPSKMDPKVMMELSQLIQQLPHDKLMRMQSLMHNMMAGFDVRKEMEEFEKSLPPGFREKLTQIMMGPGGQSMASAFGAGATSAPASTNEIEAEIVDPSPQDMNLREARLTLLRAVAEGKLTPEDAERMLFPES